MLVRSLIAAALLAAPAYALAAPDEARHEAKIRNMREYIEAVVDPQRGVYIQGYTGQWYYARVRGQCPRLNRFARLRFNPSPSGDFDRFSSIRADGFHCFVESVTEVAGPPRRES